MALILVIDDEPCNLALFKTRLTQAGHEVIEAAEVSAGMVEMEKRTARLVLCDLYLPNEEGLRVIPELRRPFPSVIIVVTYGSSLEGPEDLLPVATALGADRSIQKPFQMDQVLDLITSLLWETRRGNANQFA